VRVPSSRLLLVVAPAATLASVDQIVKASVHTPWWAFHHRSQGWVILSMALLIGAVLLALVPSRLVAVAAGVMGGGALGNLVSARWDGNWVQNPLVIDHYGHGFAFNLADVFFMLGNLLLMSALIVFTVRHRERLDQPRAWERALLRQLRVGR
jgi:sugar phosphate permease